MMTQACMVGGSDRFHMSRASGLLMSISSILAHAGRVLSADVHLHSLLKSDLEADLPLHISLSRTLMLATYQRQPFTDAIEKAIAASGVRPFSVTFNDLRWVPNYENNRWFLVLPIAKPPGDGLNKLLASLNTVAETFGQPALYVQGIKPSVAGKGRESARLDKGPEAATPNRRLGGAGNQTLEDMSVCFHVSIGWTLERPPETAFNRTVAVYDKREGVKLELAIQTVKAKIGNAIMVLPLASRAVESNGIVGL
ncbi:MAG: hypothetical protein Q9181_005092 [Wetmoreana brouardii]